MSRRVIDLIKLLITIEERFSKVYKNIALIDGTYSTQVKTAANVLASQELMHAQSYKEMFGQSEIQELEIPDELYEITKELLVDFRKKILLEQMSDIKTLVEYAIHFEKENARVLEIVLNSIEEENTDFIKLLRELIEVEKEHSRTLKSFIN